MTQIDVICLFFPLSNSPFCLKSSVAGTYTYTCRAIYCRYIVHDTQKRVGSNRYKCPIVTVQYPFISGVYPYSDAPSRNHADDPPWFVDQIFPYVAAMRQKINLICAMFVAKRSCQPSALASD
jgi:hypothetical protein